MPIVVNPGYVWPPETDPVVSPDGRITAIVDPAHAGVLLRADYSDMGDQRVRTNVIKGDVNGTWGTSAVTNVSVADGWRRITTTLNGVTTYLSSPGPFPTTIPVSPGMWHLSHEVRIPETVTPVDVDLRVQVKDSADNSIGGILPVARQIVQPGQQITIAGSVELPTGAVGLRVLLYPKDATGQYTEGNVLDVRHFYVGLPGPYFNGSTPDTDRFRYDWNGAVDASSSTETPIVSRLVARVRFERQDGTLARSGNPAWAPGGYAHAYDHEATLGGGTLWRAVPILFDGTEGEPSEYVGAVIPALSDGWAWLKPVADPDKAMLLKVEPPDLSYDGRVDTTSIAGSARPAATWDVLEGFTTQLRSLVREKTVADQLMALLDEGPVLAQFPACAGLPDFYFIRGKVDLEHVHWDGYPWRRYQWDVISIDRPDTTDSPLRIPDLSYDTVERDWTTYDQLAATVDSYNKLLEP